METILGEIVSQIIFLAPLYFINAFLLVQATIMLKLTKKDKFAFDKPLSKRFFGSQRTAIGLLFTVISSALIYSLFFQKTLEGAVLGTGMYFGILGVSFVKRTLNKKEGEKFLLDTIDFIAGAQIFYFAFFGVIFSQILIILIITALLHRTTNIIAYKLKLKKIPW